MQNIKNYIYSHSTKYICTQGIILHPATVYLCNFTELYLFNFKEMIYVLTVKEINSFKEHIFFHKKYNHSRQLYSFTEYIHFKEISSFKENLFIQGSYIHLRKYIHLRNIYSFMFKAICSFKETIFIQQRCARGHSRNIYSKLNCPQQLNDNYKLYNCYLLTKV